MKKRYAFLMFSCIIVIVVIFFFSWIQTSNKEELLTEYLEDKYNKEFIVNEEIESADVDGVLWAYSVSPLDEEKIKFVAGQKNEKNIFPFMIPIANRAFFDNYFDEAKKQIMSEVLREKTFCLSEDTNIADLSESIYSLMEEINRRLAAEGFSTTKYTCSIELNITVKQKTQTINFYILDKSKIYDLLYNSYFNR